MTMGEWKGVEAPSPWSRASSSDHETLLASESSVLWLLYNFLFPFTLIFIFFAHTLGLALSGRKVLTRLLDSNNIGPLSRRVIDLINEPSHRNLLSSHI